jgi:uncharacterized protein YqeY
MKLKERIDQDIKQAMLQKNKQELNALRSIKSLILLAETEKGAGDGLSQDAEMRILTKAAKQRKESAELYSKEGRTDLAEVEEGELEIINRYLPKQLSEEEVSDILDTIIRETGAAGPSDMGKVMGRATKELAGKADGKVIASMVKSKLT